MLEDHDASIQDLDAIIATNLVLEAKHHLHAIVYIILKTSTFSICRAHGLPKVMYQLPI